MSKYPEVITQEILEKSADISDETIRQDIADTERDLVNYRKELEGHKLIAEANLGNPKGKMAYFHEGATEGRIKECEEFLDFLTKLQDARTTVPLTLDKN